jgi:hypothetical protein
VQIPVSSDVSYTTSPQASSFQEITKSISILKAGSSISTLNSHEDSNSLNDQIFNGNEMVSTINVHRMSPRKLNFQNKNNFDFIQHGADNTVQVPTNYDGKDSCEVQQDLDQSRSADKSSEDMSNKIKSIEHELQAQKQAFKELEARLKSEIEKKDASIQSYEMSNKALKRKIKALKLQVNRRNVKISTYEDVIKHLKNEKLVSQNAADVLEKTLEPSAFSLIRRVRSSQNKTSSKGDGGNSDKKNLPRLKYDPQIRAFALTLHFYSPRAYEYVRKCFSNCLPNRRTIRYWLSHINAEPGFTGETMDAIRRRDAD